MLILPVKRCLKCRTNFCHIKILHVCTAMGTNPFKWQIKQKIVDYKYNEFFTEKNNLSVELYMDFFA